MGQVSIRSADGSSRPIDVTPVPFKREPKPFPIDFLPPVPARMFDAVGHCIYCGSLDGNLSREHIVPFGLGGTFVLPASSCTVCAGITSAFERKVLRGPMWAVRAHLQLKSRRASLAPKSAPLIVVRRGKEELVELPLAEHPLFLMFPRFVVPSIFTGDHKTGVTMRGYAAYHFGRNPRDVVSDLGADDFRHTQDYSVVPFAQLLGKIAWSMAAAEGRLTRIDRAGASLVDALIRSPDDIGKWVGTFPEPPSPQPGVLHTVVPMEIDGYLVYHIQLFADAQTPRYGVVVGRVAEETVPLVTRAPSSAQA